MNKQQALEAISTGHAIYSVKTAEEICDALGVSCPETLMEVYETDRSPLGVRMYRGPEKGAWSLDLARHAAECLGVKHQAKSFLGRGSQAREYARVVAEKLAGVAP